MGASLGVHGDVSISGSRVKILCLMTDAFGGYGGIAQYNCDLLRALSNIDRVNEVRVLTRARVAVTGLLPPKIVQTVGGHARSEYALRSLFAALRFRPDWVFCGHLYMLPLALIVCRLVSAKLWLQIHGIEAWETPNRWVQKAAAKADLVTVVSRYSRWRFLQWADTLAHRVRVLPNTVGEQFSPDPDARRRLGYSGHKILLTVSRLAPAERYKGHDRVISVLPAVLDQCPSLLYLVAGDGPDRARLESLAKAHGVENAVHFLGKVDDVRLIELYQAADVFVMPSVKEGFGIVFLEAAACGAQVIGGNADGSVDALAEGDIGFVINPHNLQALKRAILESLAAPGSRRDRGARFRRNHFQAHIERIFVTNE